MPQSFSPAVVVLGLVAVVAIIHTLSDKSVRISPEAYNALLKLVNQSKATNAAGSDLKPRMLADNSGNQQKASKNEGSSASDPKDSRAQMLEAAKKISATQGFVMLLFLNEAYLDMTKNWLCRVAKVAPDAVRGVLFVTTSQALSDQLTAWNPSVWTFPQAYSQAAGVSYGSYAYFRLTEERLIIQNYLIQGGVNVVVVESDATWNSPKIMDVLREKLNLHDIVSADEVSAGDLGHASCACLLGVSSNAKTRPFFQSYIDKYAGILHPHENKTGNIGHMGEQKVFTKMLTGSGIDIDWLTQCQSANGRWYTGKNYLKECPVPLVIQNNWIKGNAKKIARVKKWKQWFLKEDGNCIPSEEQYLEPQKPS